MKARFDIVCFDCDSTLSRVEGIDELAASAGIGAEMAALTKAAMDGEMKLEDIYAKRLEMIRPNQAAIEALAQQYIDEMVEGADSVIRELQAHGCEVHIISGGIRQAILPLAALLGVAETQVHAVDLLYQADGSYADFDRQSPAAISGGKARICKAIIHDGQSLAMVGDGITDLETAAAGAFVIGFGGVEARAKVQQEADVFITENSLTPVLKHTLI